MEMAGPWGGRPLMQRERRVLHVAQSCPGHGGSRAGRAQQPGRPRVGHTEGARGRGGGG